MDMGRGLTNGERHESGYKSLEVSWDGGCGTSTVQTAVDTQTVAQPVRSLMRLL